MVQYKCTCIIIIIIIRECLLIFSCIYLFTGLNAAEIAGIVVGVSMTLLAVVLMVIVLMVVLRMRRPPYKAQQFKGKHFDMFKY